MSRHLGAGQLNRNKNGKRINGGRPCAAWACPASAPAVVPVSYPLSAAPCGLSAASVPRWAGFVQIAGLLSGSWWIRWFYPVN